jgi:hypothetical protein
MRIEFLGPVPELRLTFPRESNPEPVWDALTEQEVVPSGAYAVTTDQRVLVHAKLFDRDGRPLSASRAGKLLHWFQRQLAPTAR